MTRRSAPLIVELLESLTTGPKILGLVQAGRVLEGPGVLEAVEVPGELSARRVADDDPIQVPPAPERAPLVDPRLSC